MKLECWGASPPVVSQMKQPSWEARLPTVRDRNLKEISLSGQSPILFGSHEACEVRIAGASLMGALFRAGDKLFFTPLVDDTWLCLQDIGIRVPLRDGELMEFRLADGISGCSLHVEVLGGDMVLRSGQGASVILDLDSSQHAKSPSDGAMLFQGSFDIGRGRGRPEKCKAAEQGFKRCAISRELDYIPKSLACVRKDGPSGTGFWLEPHCDDMRRDPERLRSTWLRLSMGVAYYIPMGAREEHVAVSIGGELVTVSSNMHDRLRNPSHAPPTLLHPNGKEELFRSISSLCGLAHVQELGHACGMACHLEANGTVGPPVSPQKQWSIGQEEQVNSQSREVVRVLHTVAPSVSHAAFALASKHGLQSDRKALEAIWDDMGCEDSTDLRYLVTDADMLSQFRDMCKGFAKSSVDSLIDDLRSIVDFAIFSMKPDGFDECLK